MPIALAKDPVSWANEQDAEQELEHQSQPEPGAAVNATAAQDLKPQTACRIPSMRQPLRQPLRLVSTKSMNRDDWLEVRKTGIGSSDAAAAVGLNPYMSALELYLIKTGQDEHLPKVDPDDESSPLYWGTMLEHIVAAHYTKRTGRRVRKINAVLQHPEHPWMLANIDREVVGSDEVQILECKTAGIHGSRLWKDGVPEYVQLQVMHQLAVTGKQAADVAVLLGGQELQIHRIERDEAMIAQLIALEQQFWGYVQSRIPPAVDGSDSADRALRALFPRETEEFKDFSQDRSLSVLFEDYLDTRSQAERMKAKEDALKQQLQMAMGTAAKAQFETGFITWRKSKDSQTLDTKRLLAEHPELLKSYGINKAGSRRFVVQTSGRQGLE
jgi:putative phage-type endonuclease